MPDDRDRLLRTPRRDLAAARRSTSTWARLAFVPEPTGDGQLVDRNRAARFGVLWAAQYDRRPDDLPLLRFLLDQETRRYRETAPIGLGRGLELAGLLVAEHRQPEDVWLHWQAKQVTFDTALGYRTHHLLTAGVAATVAAVRASAHPDRDRIAHEITAARNHDGTPHFTDKAVDDWLAAQRTRFPDHPDEENPRDWADHAALLGDREAARRFLLQWAATQLRTEQMLNSLQFGLAHLGFLDEAIDVQTEAVAVCEAGSGKAGALLTLIRLHRTAGHFAEARQALRDCGDAMPADPFWKDAGLWRYFVKEHFLLVPLAPNPELAQRLLDEGARQMRGVSRLWMDGVLDAAIAAAEHSGQPHLLDHYRQLHAREQRARDEEIGRATRSAHSTPTDEAARHTPGLTLPT
ncbi:hypothetical protein AB0B57_35345 [Micromonospora sp. NPDC049101]|uniref:hypothetical protein n=1 Tax=Micromonospora sp. NPDC049101 TaxID=3155032 RepID=UPI0033D9AC46